MMYDVILTQKDEQYIARAKEWPDVMAIENSRDAAIDQLKLKLLEYLTNQVEVVQVEIPLSIQTADPWLNTFGCFKDDPTFEDLQAEIAAYRQQIDREIDPLTA